jgi:prepilin-type N-terminal cleavage/methylation domain-containing protein
VRKILATLRHEDGGFGLIELLIAMTVLVVGLLSLVAAFSSGYVATNRASVTGTASVLADRQMEAYRGMTFRAIASVTTSYSSSTTPPSPDGRQYTVTATVDSSQTAPNTTQPIKIATVVVTDANGREWAREQSTFDQLTGS